MATRFHITSLDGTQIAVYAAAPLVKPRGAIVVLQEIFGLNSHICSVVDGYAARGYYALAPATYQRVSPGIELGYTLEDIEQGMALKAAAEALADKVMQDVQAAVDYAAKDSGCKVGVVGYCWGGLLTWRAATKLRGISAAVPYYGGGMTRELNLVPRCPTMAHLSDNDLSVPMDGVAALQKAHPGVQVHIYSAAHGFNCDQRGAYQESAALQARERTLAFFDKHLAR